MASASRSIVWIRRLVPAALGAGLLYLTWRLVTANDALLTLDFLVLRVELAVWEALLGAFVCGAALTGLLALYQAARGGLVERRYRRRLRALETEVHQLRNLPLASDPDAEPSSSVARAMPAAEGRAAGGGGRRGTIS